MCRLYVLQAIRTIPTLFISVGRDISQSRHHRVYISRNFRFFIGHDAVTVDRYHAFPPGPSPLDWSPPQIVPRDYGNSVRNARPSRPLGAGRIQKYVFRTFSVRLGAGGFVHPETGRKPGDPNGI